MEKPEMDEWAEGSAEVFAPKMKKSWPSILTKVVLVILNLRKQADLRAHKQLQVPTPGQWTPHQDPPIYSPSSLARPLPSTALWPLSLRTMTVSYSCNKTPQNLCACRDLWGPGLTPRKPTPGANGWEIPSRKGLLQIALPSLRL